MKDYEAGKKSLNLKGLSWESQFHTIRIHRDSFFTFLLSSGQLYGLEKFWAFLKYSKAKNLEIDPKLQEYLSKFKRLEDFRIDVCGGFFGV